MLQLLSQSSDLPRLLRSFKRFQKAFIEASWASSPHGFAHAASRYGDVDEVSEALAPAGVEPVVRVPQAGAHILSPQLSL